MIKFWFKLPQKLRFLIVGSFNALVSYLIYSLICIFKGVFAYQIALAFAWGISSVVSFSTQKFLVFKSNKIWYREYLKCCMTWFFSYLINAGLLEICVKSLKLNVFIAQIVATGATAVFTYILFKKFAFKGL